ncbi:MAG: methyl-accepting chemotaxis protein [Planctomycetota bacterium]|jgi:methyl-accepting chemotaxis protein
MFAFLRNLSPRMRLVILLSLLVGAAVLVALEYTVFQHDTLKQVPWATITGVAMFLVGWVIGSTTIMAPVRALGDWVRASTQGGGAAKAAVNDLPDGSELGQLQDEFVRLAHSLTSQVARSHALIGQTQESIRKISASTANILAISNEQASGANEQASAVQEASTTSKEIAVTAKEITTTAQSVQKMAERATTSCASGTDSVGNAITGMTELKTQVQSVAERMVELGDNSQKIGGVLDIIEEISEQTNLLALNAAIEAAGAGESGKRFGVVAAEVRRLAEKTVDATNQIKKIIDRIQSSTNTTIMVTEQSLKAVDSSFELVTTVGEALGGIDDAVSETTRAAKEITFSTQQQTSACEQMAVTISEVSQVAEHFVRGTEEIANALTELNNLADLLKSMLKEDAPAEAAAEAEPIAG